MVCHNLNEAAFMLMDIVRTAFSVASKNFRLYNHFLFYSFYLFFIYSKFSENIINEQIPITIFRKITATDFTSVLFNLYSLLLLSITGKHKTLVFLADIVPLELNYEKIKYYATYSPFNYR